MFRFSHELIFKSAFSSKKIPGIVKLAREAKIKSNSIIQILHYWRYKQLTLLFLAALVLRLSISHLGFHDDIYSNTAWGEWIFKNGPKGFYEASGWIYSSPTQFPLISLLYGFNHFLYDRLMFLFANMGLWVATYHLAPSKMLWFFDFSTWFGNSMYQVTPFKFGALISMKVVAILADLAIASVIYLLAKNHLKKPLLWSLAYLLSPFSWYLSALWGQYDQTSFLFLLLAFILLIRRFLFMAPLLLLISVELKPTSLIFVPLFLYIYFRLKPKLPEVVIGVVSSIILFAYSISMFTDRNIFNFLQGELLPRIFSKSEPRVSTNAFNFWRIFIGNAALNQDTILFLLPTKVWGYALFLVTYVISLKILKVVTAENIFKSLFIIGGGGFLFLTNMLDRYFFPGVAFLLILTIYQKGLFKYWLILSFIFWLNLFNQWWFPDSLGILREILLWQGSFITRILAGINVIVFILVLRKYEIKLFQKN